MLTFLEGGVDLEDVLRRSVQLLAQVTKQAAVVQMPKLKVIADDYVDMEFGTGAVKITPAHDPNDYQMGLRHNLDDATLLGSED